MDNRGYHRAASSFKEAAASEVDDKTQLSSGSSSRIFAGSALFSHKKQGRQEEREDSFIVPAENYYDVIVIGAGFAGLFAAQQICKTQPTAKVALIDPKGILSPKSTSQNECFKMHTGLHYIKDRETAKECLRNTVEMADTFCNYIQDIENPAAPSRRGRHYLMNNTDSPTEAYVKAECEHLKNYYAELLKIYPNARKVLGEPENFITYLERDQFSYVADKIDFEKADGTTESTQVILGIETPECQINVARFADHFESVFWYLRDRLKLLFEHTVVSVSYPRRSLGYIVETRRSNGVREQWFAKAAINCTWQNIDPIDSHLNFQHNDYRPCTVRAKLWVKAAVPASLAEMNTCIFLTGPQASFTRVPGSKDNPEGEVIVTYEPVTNLGHFPSGTALCQIQDEKLKKLIDPTLSEASVERTVALEVLKYKIMKGAVKYIPQLKHAKIMSSGIGFVKIFEQFESGNEYLYDTHGAIHKRREDGVQKRDLCYISFSGMKMTYAYGAAQKVAELLEREFKIRDCIHDLLQEYMEAFRIDVPGELKSNPMLYALFRLRLLAQLPQDIADVPIQDLPEVLAKWRLNITTAPTKYNDPTYELNHGPMMGSNSMFYDYFDRLQDDGTLFYDHFDQLKNDKTLASKLRPLQKK